MSPKIPGWYVMAMWSLSMRKKKFIDQLSCTISAIMRKKIKWPSGDHFGFISAKFVMGYPCVDITFCFTFMVQVFCFFFELRKYHKIIKIQNSR